MWLTLYFYWLAQIYRFNVIPIKILPGRITEIEKLILKCMWKCEELEKGKQI